MKRLLLILLLGSSTAFAQDSIPEVHTLLLRYSRTSVGFNFMAGQSDVRYINDGTVIQSTEDLFKNAEDGVFSFSGNVFFQYKLDRFFDVNWGIGYSTVGYRSTEDISLVPTNGNDFISIVHRQDYLELPVNVNVNIFRGFYASVGGTLGILADTRYKQRMVGQDPVRGHDGGPHREFLVSGSIGLGYKKSISTRWKVYVEPTYSYTFTPSNYNLHLDRAPLRMGAKFGIVKNLE